MRTNIRKAAVTVMCMFSLCLSACGSGSDKDSTTYKKLDDTDDTVYSIGIIQSADHISDSDMTLGFTDALNDTFGEGHIKLKTETASTERNTDSIASGMVQDGVQLIMADGEQALVSASIASDSLPVVGVNVKDFQSTLHIYTAGKSWDRTTHRNITGIASAPNMPQTLSLLIEATPDLKTVGILYAPEDTNAIFLNERLESYLDEAGIAWKEYEVPSSASALAQAAALEASNGSAIAPDKMVAASAKEGPNNDVQTIGDKGILSGINSSDAVRAARISQYWYGGKDAAKPADFITNTADQSPYVTTLDANASAADVISYALGECSVLYISADSYLNDQAAYIASQATAAGVSTVSGDTTAGESTLASLYTDAYNQGYEAGKLAYRILVEGDDPGEIEIKGVSKSAVQKLYQDSVASQLNITFPKSFEDVDTFLNTRVPGEFTERVTSDSDN